MCSQVCVPVSLCPQHPHVHRQLILQPTLCNWFPKLPAGIKKKKKKVKITSQPAYDEENAELFDNDTVRLPLPVPCCWQQAWVRCEPLQLVRTPLENCCTERMGNKTPRQLLHLSCKNWGLG